MWYRRAHTRLTDSFLNNVMRIVTGCLRPTPTDFLPILSGIQIVDLRQQGAILSLAYRSLMNFKHVLHQLIVGPTTTLKERTTISTLFCVGCIRKLFEELF